MWTRRQLKWKLICIILNSVAIGTFLAFASLLLAYERAISALTCGIFILMFIGLDWILVNEFSWYMKHFTEEHWKHFDKENSR